MAIRVAILDDYQRVALRMANWRSLEPEVEVAAFPDHLDSVDAVAARLRPFDAVVLMRERTPFPASIFPKLPHLKLIVTSGHRNASIDLEAATQHKVQVCGTPMLPYPTAELTWGLILSAVRHIPAEIKATREGRWQTTLGTGLLGKTLGILGLGRLGAHVAKIGQVFGMETIAWSQNLTAERAAEHGVTRVDKDELFARSDVITIHMQLSERTENLIGDAELRHMKPSAWLVNTSRGPIVDEKALLQVLRERRIAGAALDVFDQEPLPAHHPFLALDNALVTPHLGYVTEENYAQAYVVAVDDIRAFLQGKVLNPLNKLG